MSKQDRQTDEFDLNENLIPEVFRTLQSDSKTSHLKFKEVEAIVKQTFAVLGAAITSGEVNRVEISKFGTFTVNSRKGGKLLFSPKDRSPILDENGQQKTSEDTLVVKFKASRRMKAALKS